MQIILHSGSAKTLADEAFQLAKEKKFKEAYAKMEQAETEGILKAHQAQTLVIQEEARGLAHVPSLLFTHAQDHLMTTMCEVSQIKRLIEPVRTDRWSAVIQNRRKPDGKREI